MGRRTGRRSMAALLAAVMVFTAAPVSANAAEFADVADEVLEEVSGGSQTDTETAEKALEEKDGEEDSDFHGTEEQAPENGEHSESKTGQTESPEMTGASGEEETVLHPSKDDEETAETEAVTEEDGAEEDTEEEIEQAESESEPEIEEITADEIVLYAADSFTQSEAANWINNQIGKSIDADGVWGGGSVCRSDS